MALIIASASEVHGDQQPQSQNLINNLRASDVKLRRAAAERLDQTTLDQLQADMGKQLSETMGSLVQGYRSSQDLMVKSAAARVLVILATAEACDGEIIRATGAIRVLLKTLDAKDLYTRKLAGSALAKLFHADAGRQALTEIPSGLKSLIEGARAKEDFFGGINEKEVNVEVAKATAIFCDSEIGREAFIQVKGALKALISWFCWPKVHEMRSSALNAIANVCKSDRGIGAFIREEGVVSLTACLKDGKNDRETLFQAAIVFLTLSQSNAGREEVNPEHFLEGCLTCLKLQDKELSFTGFQVLNNLITNKKLTIRESSKKILMECLVSLANSGDSRMEDIACEWILQRFDKMPGPYFWSLDSRINELASINGLMDALFLAFKFNDSKRVLRAFAVVSQSIERH